MSLTQEQINSQNTPLRRKKIKIELLNTDLQVIDTLEGIATGGSITANANNTIRRSGNISLCIPIDKSKTTFLDRIDNMRISYNGKIWLDKRIKVYVGLENNSETVWYKLGVFIIDKPVRDFSSNEYQISFNVVDQMVLLTGERQGQLTGLGVEIPMFTDSENWEDGLITASQELSIGTNSASTDSTITKSTKAFDSQDGVILATMSEDGATINFYRQPIGGQFSVFQLDKTALQSQTIKDAAFVTFTQIAILYQDNKIYVYDIQSNALVLNDTIDIYGGGGGIIAPYLLYADSNYIYAAGTNGVGFIRSSTHDFVRRKTSSYATTFLKFRSTASALLFMGTKGAKNVIGGFNLTSYEEFVPLPSSFYLLDTSNYIFDFDVSLPTEPAQLESLVLTTTSGLVSEPHVFGFSTDDHGLTFTQMPMQFPIVTSATYRIACALGTYSNYFVISPTSTNYSFFLYDTNNNILRQVKEFSVSAGRVYYFSIEQGVFSNSQTSLSGIFDPTLTIMGFGLGTDSASSINLVSYSINSNTTQIPTILYDALDKVLRQLSIIKRYVLHPMEGDFKYLPFDIKVSTSATVWDILNKFQQILSTWQFYFDLDGVFRVEPIPSGNDDIVYPLNSEYYIRDQNNYDFNNVKNQVVVYGKANEGSFFSDNVSINALSQTMTLTFDEFNVNALTIKGTKIAFQPSSVPSNATISKVVIQTSQNWTQDITTASGSSNYLYYIDNVWYWLNQQTIYRSTDGSTWTQVYTASTVLTKIVSDGSTYVAMGTDQFVYSEDGGLTWSNGSINSFPSGGQLLDFDFGGNDWRATFRGGNLNQYISSTNGKNWTIHNSNTGLFLKFVKLKYANGLWVGVTNESGSYSSYNGIYVWNGSSWTGLNTSDIGFQSLKYVNNIWFAGGWDGIYYSLDGLTWTHYDQFNTTYPYDFSYGAGLFVCGVHNHYVDGGAGLLYSNDGQNWQRSKSPVEDMINYVNFSNGYFVAVGNNNVYVSSDGIEWRAIRTSSTSPYAWIYDSNKVILAELYGNIALYSLDDPQNRFQITGDLYSFEGEQLSVSSNDFEPNEIYILRILSATLDDENLVMLTRAISFENYSRLQPRACLVEDSTESPFYINRGLASPNFYGGESYDDSDADYAIKIPNSSSLVSLADGTLITFMAHKKNGLNPTITIYAEDGTTKLATEATLLGARKFVYGTTAELRYDFEAATLFNDYTIHLIKYISSTNTFEYLGVSPSVYSLVLSGGEYDNISADQLAYERCLWELYQHTNLQDNLTLDIVPDYAIDVNRKIPYDPSRSVPQGESVPSETQFFLTKQVTYPLGFDATPQTINAIRIYDDGGLLG